jgi:hypothetical protein
MLSLTRNQNVGGGKFQNTIKGLLKHRIACPALYKTDQDLTNYMRLRFLRLSSYELMPFIYPVIYDLTENGEEETDFALPPVT